MVRAKVDRVAVTDCANAAPPIPAVVAAKPQSVRFAAPEANTPPPEEVAVVATKALDAAASVAAHAPPPLNREAVRQNVVPFVARDAPRAPPPQQQPRAVVLRKKLPWTDVTVPSAAKTPPPACSRRHAIDKRGVKKKAPQVAKENNTSCVSRRGSVTESQPGVRTPSVDEPRTATADSVTDTDAADKTLAVVTGPTYTAPPPPVA